MSLWDKVRSALGIGKAKRAPAPPEPGILTRLFTEPPPPPIEPTPVQTAPEHTMASYLEQMARDKRRKLGKPKDSAAWNAYLEALPKDRTDKARAETFWKGWIAPNVSTPVRARNRELSFEWLVAHGVEPRDLPWSDWRQWAGYDRKNKG